MNRKTPPPKPCLAALMAAGLQQLALESHQRQAPSLHIAPPASRLQSLLNRKQPTSHA